MTTQENVLKILHLNDLHSHFENYPKIKRFFADKSEGIRMFYGLILEIMLTARMPLVRQH
jgi:2',3'-cyclic-nucleotide 2'-phosphodiesterase (5'-nucleotidase family)